MSRVQPLLSFLGPLAAPRASPSRQLLRFSTATRLRVDQPETSTLGATTPPLTAAATPATPSNPTFKAPSTPSNTPRTILPIAKSSTPELDSRVRKTKPYRPSQYAKPSKDAPNTGSAFPEPFIPSKAKIMKSRPLKPTTPKTKTVTPTTVALPPPKYHVSRSHNQNYPVYSDIKRGGNLRLTTVRKITGDLSALRDELRIFLNKQDDEVKINQLTAHVIVKGRHVSEITEFLKARGF